MIKINGKVYEGNSLLIDKHGNVIIDGVLQGSIEQKKIEPSNNILMFCTSPIMLAKLLAIIVLLCCYCWMKF